MNKRWLRQVGSIVVAMLLMISAILGDITSVYAALSDDSFEEDNSFLNETYSSTEGDDMLPAGTNEHLIINDTTNDELPENMELIEEDNVTADGVISETETVSENAPEVGIDDEYSEISPDGTYYGPNLSDPAYVNLNPYSYGQCTWYCYGRVKEKLGITMPTLYGDAKDWRYLAEQNGLSTGNTPAENSIMVMGMGSCNNYNHAGVHGHVAFVEYISGSYMRITDGNVIGANGYAGRDIPAYRAGQVASSSDYLSCPSCFAGYPVLGYIYFGSAPTPTPAPEPIGEPLETGYTRVVPDGYYQIVSDINSDFALDIQGYAANEISDGSKLQLFKNRNVNQDVFYLSYSSSDRFYRIKHVLSGKYLDVKDANRHRGATVQAFKDKPTEDAQKWAIEYAGDGVNYYIKPKISGKSYCLDVYNREIKTRSDGKQYGDIWLYDINKSSAQKWRLVPYPNGTAKTIENGNYHIVSRMDNATKGLNVAGTSGNFRNVTATANLTSASQVFNVAFESSTNSYIIKQKNTKYYLEIENAGKTRNIGVATGDANGNPDGNWKKWNILNSPSASGWYYIASRETGESVHYNYSQYKENVQPVKGDKIYDDQLWKFVRAVDSVSISKSSASTKVGTNITLTATVSPSSAANKNVTWSSSNTSVATVNSSGVVTPKAVGTTNITVKTVDGGYTATCKVTVDKVPVTGVSLNKTSARIDVGEKITLTATVTPSNATNKAVKWSSSMPEMVYVDSNGVVTGKRVGAATVTAKTVDGGIAATCSISVGDAPVITGVWGGEDSFPDGVVGKEYRTGLKATGAYVCFSIVEGKLPDGLKLVDTINYGTVEISGIPTKAGIYTFTIKASAMNGSVKQQYTISITEGVAPRITYDSRTAVPGGGPIKPAEIGKPYSFTFTAEGTAPLKWSIVSGTLPNGLTLNAKTGEISGAATQLGLKDFRIRVENQYGSTEESYYINVYTNVPSIVTESLPDGMVGEKYSAFLDTTNHDGNDNKSRLYVSAGTQLDEWLDGGEIINGWYYQITGKPTKAGRFTFTLTVENSYGKSSKEFTVYIKSSKTDPSNGNNVMDGTDATIVAGQKINLKETCFRNVDESISRYIVDNKMVATISKTMLSGIKAGSVNVTAQSLVGKNKYEDVATCNVIVLNKPKLKFGIPMTYEGQTIYASDYFTTSDTNTLGATYWESSKPDVVEVTDSTAGLLTAHKSGSAKITAYFGEKGKTGTLKVSATINVKKPAFQKSDYKLLTGGKAVLSMKNVVKAQNPEWVTENENVAVAEKQLDKNGQPTGKVIVKALNFGDTVLTARIDGQEYKCTIHVGAPEISKTKLTIKVNKNATVSLTNTKLPKSNIEWYSENPGIADVSPNGKVKGIEKGQTIIYTEAGGVRNECVVTVK